VRHRNSRLTETRTLCRRSVVLSPSQERGLLNEPTHTCNDKATDCRVGLPGMRQDVHSPSFIGCAPQPSPRRRRRLSRTRNCERGAQTQTRSDALSSDSEGSGTLDRNDLEAEGDQFATARCGRQAANGLASVDNSFPRLHASCALVGERSRFGSESRPTVADAVPDGHPAPRRRDTPSQCVARRSRTTHTHAVADQPRGRPPCERRHYPAPVPRTAPAERKHAGTAQVLLEAEPRTAVVVSGV
jgi:hypothetical protein